MVTRNNADFHVSKISDRWYIYIALTSPILHLNKLIIETRKFKEAEKREIKLGTMHAWHLELFLSIHTYIYIYILVFGSSSVKDHIILTPMVLLL